MNIFIREIKANRRSLMFWCIGIFLLIAASIAKYSTMSAAGQSMKEILGQLPKSIQVIMGLDQFDIMSPIGFFGMVYLYLSLMMTIHASMIGTGIIAKEERDRTSEFLFTKPVSRNTVISAKLCAALVNIVIVNIAASVSSLAFIGYYSSGESVTGSTMKLMLGIFLLQLIFMAIGAGIAATSRRPKIAASAATGVLLGSFVLCKAIDLNSGIDFLKYITPFKYYEAKSILTGSGYEPVYYALTIAIVLLLTVQTYSMFGKRDLRV